MTERRGISRVRRRLSSRPQGRGLRHFLSWLRWWWSHDRIRVPPGEGRFLRLEPPCGVLVRGRSVRLVRRRVATSERRSAVIYEGVSARGSCRLIVPGVPVPSRLILEEGERRLSLAPDEVHPLPRRGALYEPADPGHDGVAPCPPSTTSSSSASAARPSSTPRS